MIRVRKACTALVMVSLLVSQVPISAQEAVRAAAGKPSGRPISFLVEEGFTLPEQTLLQMDDVRAFEEAREVILTIRGGNARFLVRSPRLAGEKQGGEKWQEKFRVTRRVDTNTIVMPPIRAGERHDESFVEVLVDHEKLFDDLRIATVRTGNIQTVVKAFESTPDALISWGEHFAVVDEKALDLDASYPHPDPEGEHYIDYMPIAKGDEVPDKIWGIGICGSACIRFPFGPGLVNWTVTSPHALGFYVKPETSSTLVPGSYPQQAIDGIYNYYYGYNTAVKVPDSCTAETGASWTINCCCNAALMLLGHRCKWVTPSSIGWPIL